MPRRGRWARLRDSYRALPRRRKLLVGAAAVVLVAGIALLIRFLLRPPPAEVDVVRREDVVRVLALTGEVEPVAQIDVVPEVTGELTALPVDEGELVARGEPLARIESAEARARLEQARAGLEARREELEQAERERRRAERLATAGAVAEQELEQAGLAAEQAAESVREQRARVAELETRLGRYTIASPIAGVVLERPVDRGQVVGPETVLYEIAVAGGRRIEAEADERYVDALARGMHALISPIGRDSVYEGRIIFIDRAVDPETGAVMVRLGFERMPPWLIFGLSVDVNVMVERHDDALTVARAAVADLDARPWALEVDDGRTVRRPVDVIDWPSERIVVSAGLEADDLVVLLPEQVPVGARVRPIPPDDELDGPEP
ncbi:MAG: efflux RND transporter periplasmic adaptor subunit [Gemmatimonadota bacterium]